MRVYRNIDNVAMRILLQFSATCMYENGFSALMSGKAKAWNTLDCEANMRCALSSTKPRIRGHFFVTANYEKVATSFTLMLVKINCVVPIFLIYA